MKKGPKSLFIILSLSLPLAAQNTTASLGGTVADASGAAVPEAKVTIRNTGNGFTQDTTSGTTGAFLFPRLPVGPYELRVQKEGFAAYAQSGITLAVDQAANVSVALQVGQLTSEVTVSSETELVDTRSAAGSQVINQAPIIDLPLNGRRPERLMYLVAGTVDAARNACTNCGQGGVYPGEETASINGSGSNQVNYQLDGADHNDTYLNNALPFPNPDAVQEFSLLSGNFSAEYGNAGGGIVNVVTRSGTNEIHGTAFEFLRNGALNARQFFAIAPDVLKRNQYGGSAGGPIRKNKLFVFGTYQGTRLSNAPSGIVAFVPTADQRNGDFSSLLPKALTDPVTGQTVPGNQIPASRLNPLSQYFLKYIPLPNSAGGRLNFAGAPIHTTDDQFITKADYVAGRQQLSGSYFFTNFSGPPGQVKDNLLADSSSGNQVRVQKIAINHTFTVSPTFLFATTFGYNQQRGGSISSAPFGFHAAGAKMLGPEDPPTNAQPELRVSVTSGFSINTNHKGGFDRGDWTIREVVTKIIGPHQLKIGGEAVRVDNHLTNTFQMAGNFSFSGQLSGNGLSDFMFGRSSSFTQGGGEWENVKGTKWGLFLQDDWRVSQRLTLNLGVRWDPYIPFYDRQGRVICFQPNSGKKSIRYPNAPLGFLYGGDPGCPTAGVNASAWNIEPRLGFAYRLTQDGKTSLRGGAGIYYTLPTTSFNGIADSAPFASTFTFQSVAFDDPYGSQGLANPFPANFGPHIPGPDFVFAPLNSIVLYFPTDFKVPRTVTWSLRLERQIGREWVASAVYVGNKGTHGSVGLQQNPALYIPGASTVANTQQRRIYPTVGSVRYNDPGVDSQYHALQLNLEKRFGHGLSVLTNYTPSKSTDNNSSINPFDMNLEHALSTTDVPNNFKLSGVWEVPGPKTGVRGKLLGGWSVNPIITRQSGFPFTVTSGVDNSFSGNGSDRADYLGGGSAKLSYDRSHGDMIARWFDVSKFTKNAVGTFGTAGRNILRGPRYFNADLGLLKNTRLTERVNMQIRAEFFDVLNNVNFKTPDGSLSSSQVGQITAVISDNYQQLPNSERIIQFGLKLAF
jgi:hypothetical protein